MALTVIYTKLLVSMENPKFDESIQQLLKSNYLGMSRHNISGRALHFILTKMAMIGLFISREFAIECISGTL